MEIYNISFRVLIFCPLKSTLYVQIYCPTIQKHVPMYLLYYTWKHKSEMLHNRYIHNTCIDWVSWIKYLNKERARKHTKMFWCVHHLVFHLDNDLRLHAFYYGLYVLYGARWLWSPPTCLIYHQKDSSFFFQHKK